MKMKNSIVIAALICVATLLTGCFGGKMTTTGRGGELTGTGGGRGFSEPTPFGMTLVKKGFLKMGLERQDSPWGKQTPVKEISVDGFWMDDTEVDLCRNQEIKFDVTIEEI